jgi:hypothetical protein
LEINEELVLPEHPSGLKYNLRIDKKGGIVPNSLFQTRTAPVGAGVLNLQGDAPVTPPVTPPVPPVPPVPSGIPVRISRGSMGDIGACELTEPNLYVQVPAGTTINNALVITGDFASLGAHFTPADPNDGMAQPPRFDLAFIDPVDGILKKRYFTLTAPGVASGSDPMFGATPVQICITYWVADRYNIQLGCSTPIETNVVIMIQTGEPGRIGKYYHRIGDRTDAYLIKSRTTPQMSTEVSGPEYFYTCESVFAV